MTFKIIEDLISMIKNNQIEPFMSKTHGMFSCEILDYDTISITEFELTTDLGDKITYDIDSDKIRLNDWTIPDNTNTLVLFDYLLSYMRSIVRKIVSPDINDSFGFYFINIDNF